MDAARACWVGIVSVLAEAISVVVPISILNSKYPGGVESYRRGCPNRTFCADQHLTRIGFMTPTDVEAFVTALERSGLVHRRGGQAVDLAVVDQHRGPTTPCEWIQGGKHPAGYSAVWLAGTEPGALAAPPDWKPSQSAEMHFVSNEDVGERFLGLSSKDGLDVMLDFQTGKELFLGRVQSDPVEAPSRAQHEPSRTTNAEAPMRQTHLAAPAKSGLPATSGDWRESIRQQLHEGYRHRSADGVACALCGEKGIALAFHMLERSYAEQERRDHRFVPMSASRGRVRGSFPICVGCAPPCRSCDLPIPSEDLLELGHTLGASTGVGVCNHVQWRLLVHSLLKRALRRGRFNR